MATAVATAALLKKVDASCPEDVLLCIDCSAEMGEPWGEGNVKSRLQALTKSLTYFVKHKLSFDPRHRVGVCVLLDDASLVRVHVPLILIMEAFPRLGVAR